MWRWHRVRTVCTLVRPTSRRPRRAAALGHEAILGLSITDPSQLAVVDAALVDYLGVGPIFATATKPDAAPPMGQAGLAACRSQMELPIVAIGGIDRSNAAAVIRAGADGIAVVSAVCGATDPRAAARSLAAIIHETRAAEVRDDRAILARRAVRHAGPGSALGLALPAARGPDRYRRPHRRNRRRHRFLAGNPLRLSGRQWPRTDGRGRPAISCSRPGFGPVPSTSTIRRGSWSGSLPPAG